VLVRKKEAGLDHHSNLLNQKPAPQIMLPSFLQSIDAYVQKTLKTQAEYQSGIISGLLRPQDKEEILSKWQADAILKDKEIMLQLMI